MSRSSNPKPYHVCIVRYQTPDGRRCKKSTPGAVKVSVKSETYWGRIPGENGKPVPVSLETTDLGQAWVNLRAGLRQAHQRSAGISDEFSEHALRPWEEHLQLWLDTLRAKRSTLSHVGTMASHVGTLRKMAGWERITDITATTCLVVLGRLQSELGLAAETRNHYLAHLFQFCKWLLLDGRLRANPLLSVRAINVETDRRHDRRSPTDEEISRLMTYLYGDRAKVRKGMSGPRRALGYKVGMATGFRADELRSLTEASFDLAAGSVTVTAAYSKHRRTDVQQLPAWLVDQLKAWFVAGGGCWKNFPEYHPGRLLKADLEACGIPYSVPGRAGEPLFFDFHSLRVWYASAVANTPGISPKTMMEMCRHSTPALTLRIYAKVNKDDVKRVANQIQEPGGKQPDEA